MLIRYVSTFKEFVDKHGTIDSPGMLKIPYSTIKSRLSRESVWHVGEFEIDGEAPVTRAFQIDKI